MTTFCHSGDFTHGRAKSSGIQAGVMDEGNVDFWIPRSLLRDDKELLRRSRFLQ